MIPKLSRFTFIQRFCHFICNSPFLISFAFSDSIVLFSACRPTFLGHVPMTWWAVYLPQPMPENSTLFELVNMLSPTWHATWTRFTRLWPPFNGIDSVPDVIQHDASWYACKDWLCLEQLVSQQCRASTGNTIEDSCEFNCCLYNSNWFSVALAQFERALSQDHWEQHN